MILLKPSEFTEVGSNGYKVWDIPVGWGDGSDVKGRIAPNPTRQEFWIDSEGTVTIRKYQHEIMRMIYGHVFFEALQRFVKKSIGV